MGTISLDTANHYLLFSGAGADLWDTRNGLPFAWTAIPQLAVGATWQAETEVQFLDPNDDGISGRIAGLTIYQGLDGSGGGHEGQGRGANAARAWRSLMVYAYSQLLDKNNFSDPAPSAGPVV